MYIAPAPQFNNPNFESMVSYRLHFYINMKNWVHTAPIFPSNLYVHVRTHYTFMRF